MSHELLNAAADLPVPEDDGAGRSPARPDAAAAHARLLPGPGVDARSPAGAARPLHLPARRPAGDSDAGVLDAIPARGLHAAAVVRLPRPRPPSSPASARSSRGCRRSRSTSRSSSRAQPHALPLPGDRGPRAQAGRRVAPADVRVRGADALPRGWRSSSRPARSRRSSIPCFPPDRTPRTCSRTWSRGDEARHVRRGQGRPHRRRRRARAGRADDARVLRARRRRRCRPGARARRRHAARTDHPEEAHPHGGQLPRARGGVEARRVVAQDRAVDLLLPERRRHHRPR